MEARQSSPSDSAPSGWGRVRHGQSFSCIADDIDRAVSLSGFTTYEHVVLKYLRDLCWKDARRSGQSDGAWAKPNLSAFSRATGVLRERLVEGLRGLIRAGVAVRGPDGRLTLEKDASKWVDRNGDPRLSPTALRYCMDAQPGRTKSSTKGGQNRVQGVDEISSRSGRKSVQKVDEIPSRRWTEFWALRVRAV